MIRKLPGLLLLCAAIAIIMVLAWPRKREPVYQGKTLSEWLEDASHGNLSTNGAPAAAVRHMGTNILPWLVRCIEFEPPRMRARFQGALARIPSNAIRSKMWEGDIRGYRALWGFQVLGLDGKAAAPELTRFLNDPRRRGNQAAIVGALRCMGNEGFTGLLRVVERRGPASWSAAKGIEEMYNGGFDIHRAMPGLLLLDAESRRRREAPFYQDLADALPMLYQDLRYFVGCLEECLRSADGSVRAEAARTLGHYPAYVERVRPAIAALLIARNDPVYAVREAATNAIRRIDAPILKQVEAQF